jgi:hypothetical protein
LSRALLTELKLHHLESYYWPLNKDYAYTTSETNPLA